MRDVSIRRIFLAWTVACVSLTLGCGSKLEGTYINATGQVAIEFKSGRAYLTMGVVTSPADYEVKGDKIIIKENKDDKEPIVLTRNGDGSIETPFGRMTKKRS